jgi:sugar/nucleoside kinase (ribokinase family)
MTIFGYGSVIFDRMIYRDLFLPENEIESPGGSVANVLRALASMGQRTSILTAIGNDDFGKRTLADLDRWGVEREFTHIISDRCSRSLVFEVAGGKIRPRANDKAQMTNDNGKSGEMEVGDRESGVGDRAKTVPHVEAGPYVTLRDYVLTEAEREKILSAGKWFHFDAATALSIDLARQARQRGKRVSYDCGRPTFRRRREIAELLHYCHVLKVNRHLVRELVEGSEPEMLLTRWPNLEYVFVTDGEAGAEALWREEGPQGKKVLCGESAEGSVRWIRREAKAPTEFIDPLGAGDAFMAGVIERLHRSQDQVQASSDRLHASQGKMDDDWGTLAAEALEHGMMLGARACSKPGAIGYLR